MEFEWDEAKRLSNVEKHGLDFIDVQVLFDGRTVHVGFSPRGGEARFTSTGEVDGHVITVVWTKRGEMIRLISARRARDGEERAYRTVHSG